MEKNVKEIQLKKKLLHALKKESKDTSKTQRWSILKRSKCENKENKAISDVESVSSLPTCSILACAICLDDYSEHVYAKHVQGNHVGVLVKCGHFFHFECLWQWLKTQMTCPVCRNDVQWSERHIKAALYSRLISDACVNGDLSFLPKKMDEDSISVTSVESIQANGCFKLLSNRIVPHVHGHNPTRVQSASRQSRILHFGRPRSQRTMSAQETISSVGHAQVYFL